MSVPRADRRLPLEPYALVVPAAAGLAAVAFLAWKPGVARSMLGSPRALGFSLLAAGLVLWLGWLLPRRGLGRAATVGAQLLPVLLAFGVTVLPAFGGTTVDEAGPGAPVQARAALHGIDHRASGEVLLLRLGDGSTVVRLASLDVEPGPDYQVHLVPGADRTAPDGGRHLGRLRGSRGNQNYVVPANLAIVRPVTVLLWCRAFAVPVAAATIR